MIRDRSSQFLAVAALVLFIGLSGCHSPTTQQTATRTPTDTAPAQTAPAGPLRNNGHRVGIVIDIDETISITDYPSLVLGVGTDESRPYDHAREVLTKLSQDYDLTYLTARPQWLGGETRKWLTDKGFPPGQVLTTARIIDVFWPGSFKKRSVATLRDTTPNILIGIGDRHTDVEAYIANQMLAIVVNPRRRVNYHQEAEILKNWSEIEQFFETHKDLLRNPDRLRAERGIGGPPPHPDTIPTRPEVDLSLLVELPLLGPALLIEGVVKLGLAQEQREARRALEQVHRPFNEALSRIVSEYGEENVLELELGTTRGLPVYTAIILHNGRPHRVTLDANLDLLTGPRPTHAYAEAIEARRQARLSFEDALNRALKEIEGQVYEIELEIDDGVATYEVSMSALGRYLEIEVNALTGEIIELEDETAIR